MPRYNNDGRSAKFIHTGGGGGDRGGGRGGSYQGGGKKYNDFKFTSQHNRGIQKKNRGPKGFQRLEDGDVVMGGDPQASNSGFNRRGKNKSWRKMNRNMRQQDFIFGPTWHKVLIIDGTSLNRDVILNQMLTTCRVPFTPVAYSVAGTHTVFYVEDRPMAQAIAECSGKITTGENQQLKLKILPIQSPPPANFDIQCETKVRSELERRFNPQFQTLSLTNFVMSPELIREYFLPLTRPSVVMKLLSLLEPMLNNLVGLDLSNNKLVNLEGFGALPKKAPNLKALDLRKNRIREIHVLDKIHGMQIIEVYLEDNPVCNKYKDQDSYTSDVRRRFPKVTKLDGVDIPPPITFEVSEPSKMPEIRGSSFCNEEAKKVVLTFWEQYVSLYDSNDRQPLMQAYHETATMSMMASYSQQGHVSQMDPSKKLSSYLADSRNLLRNPDKLRKYKLLHQGKLEIMAFMEKLPKTTHDPSSFVIDMPVAVESFILFNVVGLFKERDERSTPTRYFSRTFAIVPLNGGFVIVNELLFITTPTTEQIRGSFKPAAVAAATATAPVPGPSGPPPIPVPVTEEEKRNIIAMFAQESGMNEEWSRKCLEENEWNFNYSGQVFLKLKQDGKIPPAAFVK